MGGAARRAAGEVDVRAAGGVSHGLSGARSRVRDGAGARRRRPIPRAPGRQHEQRRRARGDLRAAQQGAGALDHRVRRPRRLRPRAGRAHQHVAAGRVPERRPSPGDVRHGAVDRSGGAPTRIRPGRAAPAQSGAASRHAVHESLRHRVRQRRLRGRAGSGARAGRLAGLRVAPARGEAARPLSWHRGGQLHRDRDGRAARARGGHRATGRLHRRDDRDAVGGAGSRDELRSAHRRVVRRGTGPGAPHHRGHGPRVGRRRLAFRPVDAAGRRGHGEGVRSDRREGPADRGVAARGRGRGSRVRGAAASA